ncbi:MAG: HPr family phosphocarrier protein [Clostridia bacterium]|nr:HPr family phosphocarrier protein [Clostridia bacterium]
MKSAKIRLSTIAEVRDFVNIVTAFDGDVDLVSGKYTVDGKSIMGIFSLDLLDPITVNVEDKEADELFKKIAPFIVK